MPELLLDAAGRRRSPATLPHFHAGRPPRNKGARPIPAEPSIAEVVATALGNLHNTSPFDVTGNPALSVPCGMSNGRPIGMMLVGRHFDDATVLRAGHAYEQIRGAAWNSEPVAA